MRGDPAWEAESHKLGPMIPLATALEGAAAVASASGLAVGGAAYATLYPSSQLLGPVLVAPRHPDQIALTFDDGPNPAATPRLLEVLARHGVRATFFLIGSSVRQEPALAREIAKAGHAVGNHTMTHPWLNLQSEARIRSEILDCNRALEDTLGRPVNLFRPPHGARRAVVIQTARSAGLRTVNWNVIVNDWEPVSAVILRSRLAQGFRRNRLRGYASNIVLHDGGLDQPRLATVSATDSFLSRLRETDAGISFVTLEAWLPG